MNRNQLEELLDRIPSLRIAVVGDFFLDKYLVLDPALAEVSIETGLEARQVVGIRCSPGAAGTVTNNLSALGVRSLFAIGMTGDDGEGYDLRKGLIVRGVSTEHLLAVSDRFTPTYTKPMLITGDGERELERIDIKNRRPTPPQVEDQIIAAVEQLVFNHGLDAILMADQVQERNCGVVTDRVREEVQIMADRAGLLAMADSRVRIAEFRNVIVKPNRTEAAAAMNIGGGEPDMETTRHIGRLLAERNNRPVFVTMGGDGIMACTAHDAVHVPALPVRGEIDIVGAGDSVFAGIACALALGAPPADAAYLGNLCASVTIHKLGTTGTASPEEILALVA
jgi:rfaE bifunctional protein kinase chain/domain